MGNDSYTRTPVGDKQDVLDRIDSLERRLARSSSLRLSLGVSGQQATDWDAATDAGFYWADNTATNGPGGGIFSQGVVTRSTGGDVVQRVTAVLSPTEAWVRVYSGSWSSWVPTLLRGTASERDAIFGVPSTDSARAALANRKVLWFNTDKGWEESYYATTGTTGLTAKGLKTGVAHGWYPIGSNGGPFLLLYVSAQTTLGVGTTITNWTAPGTGLSKRNGGTDWFTFSSGIPTIVKAGEYDIEISLVHAGGSIMHEYKVIKNNTDNDANTLSWVAQQLSNDAWTKSRLILQSWPAAAGDNLRCKGTLGSAVVGMDGDGSTRYSGEFSIRYSGPSLVSD